MAAWLRGCVAAWLRGCVAAWLRGVACTMGLCVRHEYYKLLGMIRVCVILV